MLIASPCRRSNSAPYLTHRKRTTRSCQVLDGSSGEIERAGLARAPLDGPLYKRPQTRLILNCRAAGMFLPPVRVCSQPA